jgi:hypothetical protein
MGLDMYAHKVQKEELAYWRKHNRLQGWFEQSILKLTQTTPTLTVKTSISTRNY